MLVNIYHLFADDFIFIRNRPIELEKYRPLFMSIIRPFHSLRHAIESKMEKDLNNVTLQP